MKRIGLIFLVLFLTVSGNTRADFFGNNASTGNIVNVSVSDSTTANSWTYLTGTNVNDYTYDTLGNRYTPKAFNISLTDGSTVYDFNYAYSNSPTAYFTWWAKTQAWGPLQANMNFPNNGLWVAPLPGVVVTPVTAQVESR